MTTNPLLDNTPLLDQDAALALDDMARAIRRLEEAFLILRRMELRDGASNAEACNMAVRLIRNFCDRARHLGAH